MTTITKKTLIHKIAARRSLHPNDVRDVLQDFLDDITQGLEAGDRYEFRDFGIFEVVVRKQKIGRNPKNASVPIVIPPRRVVKFTPGKEMREKVEKAPASKV